MHEAKSIILLEVDENILPLFNEVIKRTGSLIKTHYYTMESELSINTRSTVVENMTQRTVNVLWNIHWKDRITYFTFRR